MNVIVVTVSFTACNTRGCSVFASHCSYYVKKMDQSAIKPVSFEVPLYKSHNFEDNIFRRMSLSIRQNLCKIVLRLL